MQYYQYIDQSEFQTWPASDGTYNTLSNWNGVHEAQSLAAHSYWTTSKATSNWRNNQDSWCQENWCQSVQGPFMGKENIVKNSIRSDGAARCRRGKHPKQRRKPITASHCKIQCEAQVPKPAVPAEVPAEVSAPAPEPVPTPPSAVEDSAPLLLPEHLALLAPFLSSNVDSGSWRATCRDAKEALLPNGPFSAMLSPAGQAALVGLEKRKKLQKILESAKKLVSGFNFR